MSWESHPIAGQTRSSKAAMHVEQGKVADFETV